MQLTQDTIHLLKNFAQINQSILIKPGSILSTISVHKVILAEATVTEEFPNEVGIYDLNQFLHCLSMVPGGEIEFEDNLIRISDDSSAITYRTCDPSVIQCPPDKKFKLPSEDVCFCLTEDVLQRVSRTSSILGCPDVTIVGDGEKIVLTVRDKKNTGSNSLSVDLGETESTFTYNFKMENLKIMTGDYDVVVSKKDISQFTNHAKPIVYFVALEPDSTFES